MIFVTIGTHNQQFTRLIKRIDEIAPAIKEKIVIQRGHTKYVPKNCESFEWTPNIGRYYDEARLVISHGGSSVWEFVYNYKKPIIIVPRQHKFNEHMNDHQVEFAKKFSKNANVKAVYDVNELTPSFLEAYNTIPKINTKNLQNLQDFLKKIIANNNP